MYIKIVSPQKDKILKNFNVHVLFICNVQSVIKKKKNVPIKYCKEMKLASINMDYCLLQFDVLKVYSGVRLHGGVST